ncbi:hypothetical protein O0L34_g18624 [Tuta absoluta]|nr:hypothetical protein O0L34_g18624 [Tuta absoluta]
MEKLKASMSEALLAKEAEHSKQLQDTTSFLKKLDVATPIAEVAKGVKAIRDMISFDVIGKMDILQNESKKLHERMRQTTPVSGPNNQPSSDLMKNLLETSTNIRRL